MGWRDRDEVDGLGNPTNRDAQGNPDDRDGHGNRPRDGQGNPWGGGPSAPGWFGGESGSTSNAPASAPNPSPAPDPAPSYPIIPAPRIRMSGRGDPAPGEPSSVIHVLAAIGLMMIAVSLAAWFFDATVLGMDTTRVAVAGLVLFLIGSFPRPVGILLLIGCGFGLYEAGATPAGWSREGIPGEALAAGIAGLALGIGLLASAATPMAAWKQKGRHRTLTAVVVLPVAALVILAVVFAPAARGTPGVARVPAVVTASSLNLRAAPVPRGALVGTVTRGDTLMITGAERDGWLPVEHAAGRGYVSARYLSRLMAPANSPPAR